MPPKKSAQPTLSWDTTFHINFNIKITNAQDTSTDPTSVLIKIKPSSLSPTDLTSFHSIFLRLASNAEKPPKKASYNPTYLNASFHRVTRDWIVGGDLVSASGRNGNEVALDYSAEQLKVSQEVLSNQERLKRGSVILPSRNRYEFGSVFAILLGDAERYKHLQGDVIVIGQVTEGLDELQEALTSNGYLVNALEGSWESQGENAVDPEIQCIDKDRIVVESTEVVRVEAE